jgi:hypothetical protein
MRLLHFVISVILFAAVAPAYAQQVGPLQTPANKPWVYIAVAIALIVIVALASFMSSKRGHQD